MIGYRTSGIDPLKQTKPFGELIYRGLPLRGQRCQLCSGGTQTGGVKCLLMEVIMGI
jgi:hypothetical protein